LTYESTIPATDPTYGDYLSLNSSNASLVSGFVFPMSSMEVITEIKGDNTFLHKECATYLSNVSIPDKTGTITVYSNSTCPMNTWMVGFTTS